LLTTHYVEEAEQLSTRVAVVHFGRILVDDTAAAVRAAIGVGGRSYR
jgi:ABC-type multidrug transport system ATPase subunit